jgi:hypothetical protein
MHRVEAAMSWREAFREYKGVGTDLNPLLVVSPPPLPTGSLRPPNVFADHLGGDGKQRTADDADDEDVTSMQDNDRAPGGYTEDDEGESPSMGLTSSRRQRFAISIMLPFLLL